MVCNIVAYLKLAAHISFYVSIVAFEKLIRNILNLRRNSERSIPYWVRYPLERKEWKSYVSGICGQMLMEFNYSRLRGVSISRTIL